MANIQTYLNKIKNAIYGRDVRDSIHDAIDAINTESENTKEIIEDFVGGELDTTLTSTTLPAQGKAVGDTVNELESQIGVNDANAMQILTLQDDPAVSTWFKQGSISSGGAEVDSNNRIRSDYINLNAYKTITVTPSSGYYVAVELYDGFKSFKHELGWTVNPRTVKVGDGNNDAYYVRLLLSHTDSSIITPDESGNVTITAKTTIGSKFDDVIDIMRYRDTDLTDISNWSYGARSNDGTVAVNQIRMHSEFVRVNAGDIIYSYWNSENVRSKYKVEAVIFDLKWNRLVTSGWQVNTYTVPYDGIMSVNMAKHDNSVITSEEFNDMVACFGYTRQPKRVQNPNFTSGKMKSINHRGWHEAPENTLIAYKESFRHGFKYVETDVRFTSDNIPVCLHDATINRTARRNDGSSISDTISIGDITYEQALAYDFGIYKNSTYAGTTIPTLKEFFELCDVLGLLPYVDLGGTPEITEPQIKILVDTARACGMVGKTTYLVGRLSNGNMIVKYDKFARIGALTSLNKIFPIYVKSFLSGENDVFIDCHTSEISTDTVQNAIDADIPLETWLVNDTTYLDTMNSYITGGTSDNIIASDYLSIRSGFITPSSYLDRVQNIKGGVLIKDGWAIVDCVFTSTYTASDTPNIMLGFPIPNDDSAGLMAINVNVENTVDFVPCAVKKTNGVLTISNVTNGETYQISGMYFMGGNA